MKMKKWLATAWVNERQGDKWKRGQQDDIFLFVFLILRVIVCRLLKSIYQERNNDRSQTISFLSFIGFKCLVHRYQFFPSLLQSRYLYIYIYIYMYQSPQSQT